MVKREVQRTALTEHELTVLANKHFVIERLAIVRDVLAAKELTDLFFSITFSHHFLILTKVKDWQERIFYIKPAASNFWSLTILEYHISSQLDQKQGALPNNFSQTLPAAIKATALEVLR